MMNFGTNADTICALSTANGMGAIAVVRVSGPQAIAVMNQVFSKDITQAESHTAHFGDYKPYLYYAIKSTEGNKNFDAVEVKSDKLLKKISSVDKRELDFAKNILRN